MVPVALGLGVLAVLTLLSLGAVHYAHHFIGDAAGDED